MAGGLSRPLARLMANFWPNLNRAYWRNWQPGTRSLWKRARDAKGNLILSNPQPRVRETLNLIGFDLVFTIVDQPADVLNGKR
jgi:hypothetical protein